MTMQIKATRKNNGYIQVAIIKQDDDGYRMSNGRHNTKDPMIARALIENTIKINPRIGKVRISWEV